jgi:hypothetical protein
MPGQEDPIHKMLEGPGAGAENQGKGDGKDIPEAAFLLPSVL